MKLKINVKSISGALLTYTVDSYTTDEGQIIFYDKVDKVTKVYPISNCEITMIEDKDEN